jgi:ComEC/Rec2-related protein
MILFLIFPILFGALHLMDLHLNLAKLSVRLQNQCEFFLSHHLLSEVKQSLICGKSFKMEPDLTLFKSVGLYHLLVVSAGNLVLWTGALKILFRIFHTNKIQLSNGISAFLLGFLAMSVGFSPPIATAYFSKIVIPLVVRYPKSQSFHLCLSVLCLLMFFPGWLESLSFYLSCWCLAILGFSSNLHREISWKQLILRLCLIQWCVSLILGSFQVTSLFANLLVAPAISFLLIPLAYLSVFGTWAQNLFSGAYQILIKALQMISPGPPEPYLFAPELNHWLALAVFLTLARYFEIRKTQQWLLREDP